MRLMQLMGARQFMPTPGTSSAGTWISISLKYLLTGKVLLPTDVAHAEMLVSPTATELRSKFSQGTYDLKDGRLRDACHSQAAGSVLRAAS